MDSHGPALLSTVKTREDVRNTQQVTNVPSGLLVQTRVLPVMLSSLRARQSWEVCTLLKLSEYFYCLLFSLCSVGPDALVNEGCVSMISGG